MTERLVALPPDTEFFMPAYRIYLVGKEQHIDGAAKVFECSDDEQMVLQGKTDSRRARP